MNKVQAVGFIVLGATIGLGIGAGVVVQAASGDLIYEKHEITEITGAQAANIADAFIAVNAWSGNRSDMIRCKAERSSLSATGFRAVCAGEKSAPAVSLPIDGGVRVIGIEP